MSKVYVPNNRPCLFIIANVNKISGLPKSSYKKARTFENPETIEDYDKALAEKRAKEAAELEKWFLNLLRKEDKHYLYQETEKLEKFVHTQIFNESWSC